MARILEREWTGGWLTTLQVRIGPQQAKIAEADHTTPLPEHSEVTKHDQHSPGIQLLRATAFDYLWASEEVVEAFAISPGECQGLLGASLESITEHQTNPRKLNMQSAEAAGDVADDDTVMVLEGLLMPCRDMKEVTGQQGRSTVMNHLAQASQDPGPSPLRQITQQGKQGKCSVSNVSGLRSFGPGWNRNWDPSLG